MKPRLRFGLVYDFRNPRPRRVPFARLYHDLLEHVAVADELGFHSAWISEHHFFEDGYAPAALPLAAAMAARTERIRIGTYVIVLPLHNPIELAEQASVVDIVSRGRLSLGFGQGRRSEEFAAYGIPMAERASRMEEGLTVVRGLLREEAFDFHGKHHDLAAVTLQPRPLQDGGPPLWVAATSPAAARRAARHRAHLAPVGMREATVDVWKAKLAELDEDPASYDVTVLRPLLPTEDGTLAERIRAADALRYEYQRSYAGDSQVAAEVARLMTRRSEGTSLRVGDWLFGAPSRIADELDAYVAETGVTEVLTWAVPWGMEPRETYPHLERLARDVLPQFGGSRGRNEQLRGP